VLAPCKKDPDHPDAPCPQLTFHVTFDAPGELGLFDQAFLFIMTDQNADFGTTGLELGYRLSAEVVPEPAGSALALLLLGVAGLAVRRRRS
jgi:MYXO-CTERM domain-containing protein